MTSDHPPPRSDRQGALRGMMMGTALGAFVIGLLGVVAFDEPSSALILACIGGAFGAVAAAVYWFGLEPDLFEDDCARRR